ncbi:MAG: protein translocase subunit SecF [bacterium]|nr:protein translocase subunit SecF [bacterium]
MKFFQDQPSFNFMGKKNLAGGLSVLLILISIASFFAVGVNYGIDFKGGTLIQVQFPQEPDLGRLRSLFGDRVTGQVAITNFGDQGDHEVLITLPQDAFENNANVSAQVQEVFNKEFPVYDMRRVESVGAKVGDELKEKALDAGLFALIGILVYVGIRFHWRYGVAAVVALFHDVTITMGVFILADKEFSLTIVAAVLTIIGYSLNDTIVVFDRIRENVAKLPKSSLLDVINRSINESLSRTILTSLTTFLVVAALFIFGGEIIHDFCFAMIIGLVVGTYSSIFVASPVVWLLEQRKRAR